MDEKRAALADCGLSSVVKWQGRWFWADAAGDWHGPCSSRASAIRRQRLYRAWGLEGAEEAERVLVPSTVWGARFEAEPEHVIHPCTSPAPWDCDCAGACGCHWDVVRGG